MKIRYSWLCQGCLESGPNPENGLKKLRHSQLYLIWKFHFVVVKIIFMFVKILFQTSAQRWCCSLQVDVVWWQEEKEGCRYLNNMRSHQYFGDPKQILHWYIDWWRRKMTRKKRSCRYLNKVRRHQYIGDLTQANFTLISSGNIVTWQWKIKVVDN